ncbi:MAG: DNA internalization-related competence protein ComEC/Rec2 [Desulfonatronovibrio sp.]
MRHFSDTSLPGGVLPWQKFIMAYVLGIWTLKYPWPGLTALLLLFLFIPFKTPRLNIVTAGIFAAGFALSWLTLPGLPSQVPEEIAAGDRVLISARVDSVAFLPGQRQRIILENLEMGRDDHKEILPGRLVWTWQDVPVRIAPGQDVQAHLKVRPIHGPANMGVWNSEFFWRIQGVLWRSYSRGEHFWFRIDGDQGRSIALRQTLKDRAVSGLALSGLSEERKTQVQGLGLALFFGDRYLLDPVLVDSIRLASLAHSLALSGLHLSIMAAMGFFLAGFAGFLYPRIYLFLPFMKLGVLLAAPLCLTYIWMGQAPPTLVRSGIMLASWGFLLFMNQKRVLLDGLFLATAVITLMDPWSVFDLRLQLSVTAVAGIALVLPLLDSGLKKFRRIWKTTTIRYFLGLAGVTIAANLALLPVQAWTFNYISPHLYLNLVWLPVLGFVVLPAGIIGLFMSVVPGLEWLGSVFMALSGYTLNYFIEFLDYLGRKDLLHPVITPRPWWQHILAYWLGIMLIIYGRRIRFKNKSHLLGLVLFVCLIVIPIFRSSSETGLKIRVLDVGQGQGVVLELPGYKRVLLDGGGSWNPEYDLGKQVVVPALTWRSWPGRLDWSVLSHAHVDHYGGLVYPLKYMGADKYVHGGTWPGEADAKRLKSALDRQGIIQKEAGKGNVLDLGRGVVLEVLHPEDGSDYSNLNNASLVLRLVWNEQGLALFPGDIEADGIEALLESDEDMASTVLVVPHHGSRTSADARFYERVSPEIAVVSRGFMNRFGLPHTEVLDTIAKRGVRLYDTAVHGQVVVAWKSPESSPRVTWARSRLGPGKIPYWY